MYYFQTVLTTSFRITNEIVEVNEVMEFITPENSTRAFLLTEEMIPAILQNTKGSYTKLNYIVCE